MRFLDCAGVRALASVTGLVRAGCPVIVRSLSPAAAHVLALLDVNLEWSAVAPTAQCSADEDSELVRQSRAVRTAYEEVLGRLLGTAEEVAQTEDRIAATMALLARQQPHRAARLGALSEQARSYATSLRRLAYQSSRQAAESTAETLRTG